MLGVTTPISDVTVRHRAVVAGRVRSVRIRPWGDVPTLEVVLVDDTAGITVVFLARRRIHGIRPGTRMSVEGVVGTDRDRLVILNPAYELEG